MTGFVAADLDRTLIFSAAAVGPAGTAGLVAVETVEGRPTSFVTASATPWIAALAAHPRFVLVTSRSEAQVRRTALPGGLPRRVLCANGARLIVDGELDARHSASWAARLASYPLGEELAAGARAVVDALDDPDDPDGTVSIRAVDETFAVARFGDVSRARRADVALRTWAAHVGAEVVASGRKLYVLPRPLSKAAALRLLSDRSPVEAAAGDSALDTPMLADAAETLVPAGSELAATGVHPTTMTGGVGAGVEIAAWLSRKLGTGPFG